MLGGDNDNNGISLYELEREQRIAEQNVMLKSLGLIAASPAIVGQQPFSRKRKVSENSKTTSGVSARRTKREPTNKQLDQQPTTPVRYSLRSRGQAASLSLDSNGVLSEGNAAMLDLQQVILSESNSRARAFGDIKFERDSLLDQLASLSDSSHYAEPGVSSTLLESSKSNSANEYACLKSAFPGSVKVIKEMIFAIAVHPSTVFQCLLLISKPKILKKHLPQDKLLSFVGDKRGALALWDISDTITKSKDSTFDIDDFNPSVTVFQPFKKPISKIIIPQHSTSVLLSSYDGSIRSMDIERGIFTDLFVHPNHRNEIVTHFDLSYPSSYIIWATDGSGACVAIDSREPVEMTRKFHQLSDKKINTIHLNPADPNILAVAGLDRTVKVFDIRYMGGNGQNHRRKVADDANDDDLVEPVFTLEHSLSVNSAYWDPSGKDLLSTSFDDSIGLWKNVLKSREAGLLKIKHNNQTGRWVQKFKAVWRGQDGFYNDRQKAAAEIVLPSAIVVGNMQRAVDLYGPNGIRLASLTDVSLTAIPAVNVFHPYLNIIVSGNASGRMNVWN
ncbi:hypothetical protein HK100_002752 [Physocladia obscura]|uniref:DNA damage-binding protein CMR1 n=1 Tax=Physocladia obscura TaxID=109957 RepID=A0AAD5XG44_9FUNG|nr:hypothetical protein HK100_002752 [Physocladia obscura]